MNIHEEWLGTECVLMLSGRFDFNAHRSFSDGYESALKEKSLKTIRLNMKNVDYLDTSALGMLLLLREKARASNVEVVISDCSENLRKILDIANFGNLFNLL